MANINTMLADAPLPMMVEKLGTAIADAQYAMDRNSVEIARLMGNREEHGLVIGKDGTKKSLIELGFTPTFYQITEASVEARVAFSTSKSHEFSVGASVKVSYFFVSASVNASYSARYSFEASGSSSISTKFRAVPPPNQLVDLLNGIQQSEKPAEEE